MRRTCADSVSCFLSPGSAEVEDVDTDTSPLTIGLSQYSSGSGGIGTHSPKKSTMSQKLSWMKQLGPAHSQVNDDITRLLWCDVVCCRHVLFNLLLCHHRQRKCKKTTYVKVNCGRYIDHPCHRIIHCITAHVLMFQRIKDSSFRGVLWAKFHEAFNTRCVTLSCLDVLLMNSFRCFVKCYAVLERGRLDFYRSKQHFVDINKTVNDKPIRIKAFSLELDPRFGRFFVCSRDFAQSVAVCAELLSASRHLTLSSATVVYALL